MHKMHYGRGTYRSGNLTLNNQAVPQPYMGTGGFSKLGSAGRWDSGYPFSVLLCGCLRKRLSLEGACGQLVGVGQALIFQIHFFPRGLER